MKICIIGCGSLASEAYGPSLHKYQNLCGNLVLASCCDVDMQKAAAFKDRFHFQHAYTDMRQALSETQPNAVFAIVPERLTKTVAVEILEMGYPLMMEKPPGISREEALCIQRAAHSKGTPNQVAFNRRHMPLVKELVHMAEIRQNKVHIKYDMARVGRYDEQFAWTASHAIDAVRFIVGCDYNLVKFDYSDFGQTGIKNIFMNCVFTNGSTAQITILPDSGITSERVEVHYKNNSIFLRLPIWGAYDTPGALERFSGDKRILVTAGDDIPLFESNGFYNEIEGFLNDIASNMPPKDSIDTAIQTIEVMERLMSHADEYHA